MTDPIEPRPRTRRLRAALLGTMAALACGELGLRFLGYTPHFVNPIASFHVPDAESALCGRPGFTGRFAQTEFDVQIELDARGFRKVTPSPVRAERRLFVLGDSFTWGWGVDPGQGFVDRLADAYPNVQVENLGLSGTGTVIAHRLLARHVLPELRAGDGVLLVTFENDLADNLGRNHDRWLHAAVVDGSVTTVAAPEADRAGEVKAWLKQHCCLFNLAVFVADRFKLSRKQARASVEDRSPPVDARPVDADEELVYRHYLTLIRDQVSACGATFAITCIPPRGLYEGGPPGGDAERMRHRAMLDVPRDLGIPCLDLLPALSVPIAADAEPRTFAFDEHWTATGHRIAADAMIPFVAALLGGTDGQGVTHR
ncbi:MAG: GDSL-type esterase/lipase family protein [Planctomycetota bacterium]